MLTIALNEHIIIGVKQLTLTNYDVGIRPLLVLALVLVYYLRQSFYYQHASRLCDRIIIVDLPYVPCTAREFPN